MKIFFLSFIIILHVGRSFCFSFDINELKQKIIPAKKVIKVIKSSSKDNIIISSTKKDNILPGYYLTVFSDSYPNSLIIIDRVYDYYSTAHLISGILPAAGEVLITNKVKINLNGLPSKFQKYF